MFQLIRTYLCVYTSLCPAHFIQIERRSRAGRNVEEHVVLALMPRRQEHRGVNNRKSVASTTRTIFISVLNQTLPTRQPSCRTEEEAGIIVRQRPVRPLHKHHLHTQIKHRITRLATTHLTSRIVTNMFCISLTIWLDSKGFS